MQTYLSAKSKFRSTATLLICAALMIGCHSPINNPWEGIAYEPPNDFADTPQTTYAPMPSLLPRVAAETVSVESQDDELESVLMDLESIEKEFESGR